MKKEKKTKEEEKNQIVMSLQKQIKILPFQKEVKGSAYNFTFFLSIFKKKNSFLVGHSFIHQGTHFSLIVRYFSFLNE